MPNAIGREIWRLEGIAMPMRFSGIAIPLARASVISDTADDNDKLPSIYCLIPCAKNDML